MPKFNEKIQGETIKKLSIFYHGNDIKMILDMQAVFKKLFPKIVFQRKGGHVVLKSKFDLLIHLNLDR